MELKKFRKHFIGSFLLILIGYGLMKYFPEEMPVHRGAAFGMLVFYSGIMYAICTWTWALAMYFIENLWSQKNK